MNGHLATIIFKCLTPYPILSNYSIFKFAEKYILLPGEENLENFRSMFNDYYMRHGLVLPGEDKVNTEILAEKAEAEARQAEAEAAQAKAKAEAEQANIKEGRKAVTAKAKADKAREKADIARAMQKLLEIIYVI